MEEVDQFEEGSPITIDAQYFKILVAKTIFFKTVQKILRSNRDRFKAFQANIATYLISLIAYCFEDKILFDKIWQEQRLSDQLTNQLVDWATRVSDRLHETAEGRMISEWSKKPECGEKMKTVQLELPKHKIAEFQQ